MGWVGLGWVTQNGPMDNSVTTPEPRPVLLLLLLLLTSVRRLASLARAADTFRSPLRG